MSPAHTHLLVCISVLPERVYIHHQQRPVEAIGSLGISTWTVVSHHVGARKQFTTTAASAPIC